MRAALNIALKELLQIRRDRLAALFTIIIPVIFTVFLGLVMGDLGASSKLPLAIYDADASAASKQLIQSLSKQQTLEIRYMTTAELEKAVKDQNVAAGLEIPAGYGAAVDKGQAASLTMVRLETSSGAQSVVQTVQAVVERTNNTVAAATAAAQQVAAATGGAVDAQLRQQAQQAVSAQLDKPAVTIQMVASNNSKVKQISGFEQASSGEILNFVLFALLTTATGVAWERRQGLLKRLTTVGISGRQIFAGKLMAMFSIAFLQELFLVLLGQFAFGVNYFHSPVALLVVMVSLAMLAASMGVLMAALFKSEQAVIATTVISAQLLAALAGAWFPLDITSAAFSRAAHFLPGAWVVDSLHGIILKSWGIAEVLAPMGFVWIWIAVFFGLAVWRFRPE